MAKDKEGVKLDSPANEDVKPESSFGTEEEEVSDQEIGTPSDEGKSPVAGAEEETDELGVPYKNRYEEFKRKYEESQQQSERLLDTVREIATREPAPSRGPMEPPPEVKARLKRLEDAGLGTEVVNDILSLAGSIAGAQVENLRQTMAGNAQAQLDTTQETQLDRMLEEDPYMTPYKGEVMKILRATTDLNVRSHPNAVKQATSMVYLDHRKDIESAIEKRARGEAEKNKRIIGESASGTSVRMSDGRTARLTADELKVIALYNENRVTGAPELTPEKYLQNRRRGRTSNR